MTDDYCLDSSQEELLDSLMCDGYTYDEAYELVVYGEIVALRDGYYD